MTLLLNSHLPIGLNVGAAQMNVPDAKDERNFFLRHRCALLSFGLLSLLELFCFGPIIRKVGFYLDDWITLNLLTFCSKSFFAAFYQYLLSDPRVIVRPVEAFYYTALYFMFGLKPYGYHVFNALLEVGYCFFFYLAINKLTGRAALSLVAAAVLLLYPNHDVTHYWATCSSENLSLFFFMISLYASVSAVVNARVWLHVLSAVAFALSIFCYETFLPLVVLNLAFGLIALPVRTKQSSLKTAMLILAPFGAVTAALLFYSRVLAPKMGTAQIHAVQFKLQYFATAIGEGFRINLPPAASEFFWQLILRAFDNEKAPGLIASAVIVGFLSAVCLWFVSRGKRKESEPIYLLPLGILTVLASYSIFGLNPEYVPTLQTILNRVNEGCAVGISLMVSGVVSCILALFVRANGKRPEAVVATVVTVPILVISFFVNRGFAGPWELCWLTETAIRDSIIKQGARFHAGDAIILANCPRYVMWSPLFDGVWDFQPMVQLALNNKEIKGGVVSERMSVDKEGLKDISKGFTCNTYTFDKTYFIFPPNGEIVHVDNPTAFVNLIEKRGMLFHLDRTALVRWRKEIEALPY